jgi:hypothetical protein
VANQVREVRFDFGGVSTRRQELADGRIICNATFARDGILIYRQPDGGIIRELRLPATNKDPETLTSYGVSPLTLDHPSVLVSKNNAKDLAVGFSDREVTYDRGFLRGVVMVHDGAAIARIDSGKVQLSPGYYCDVEDSPGIWQGQPYDRIQRNVLNNHIAIVDIGRNGPDVKLHWDAADSVGVQALVQQVGEVEQKIYFDFGVRQDVIRRLPMTEEQRTVTLDSVSYQVPSDLAERIAKLHVDAVDAKMKTEKAEMKTAEMEGTVAEAEEETEKAKAKMDAAMEILEAANTTLKGLGYTVNRDGEYVQDMASGPASHAAPDAAAGEEQEDGYQEMNAKGKKEDSIKDRVDAWVTAETLVPGIRATKFDADLNVHGIKRIVIDALKPGLKFDDAEVPGLHRALTENLVQPSDQSGRHADALEASLRTSNSAAAAASNRQDSAVSNVTEVDQSYLDPLALSYK